VHCAYCSEKIMGEPLKQAGNLYCSLECVKLATGIDPDEDEGFPEEESPESFLEDDDE